MKSLLQQSLNAVCVGAACRSGKKLTFADEHGGELTQVNTSAPLMLCVSWRNRVLVFDCAGYLCGGVALFGREYQLRTPTKGMLHRYVGEATVLSVEWGVCI